MVDLARDVYALLSALSAPARYQYPQSFAQTPCVVFYESGNQVLSRADGAPHLHEITYTVECFAPGAQDARALAAAADEKMTALGFIRVFAADLYEDALRACRHMARYRAVTDGAGTLTQ